MPQWFDNAVVAAVFIGGPALAISSVLAVLACTDTPSAPPVTSTVCVPSGWRVVAVLPERPALVLEGPHGESVVTGALGGTVVRLSADCAEAAR